MAEPRTPTAQPRTPTAQPPTPTTQPPTPTAQPSTYHTHTHTAQLLSRITHTLVTCSCSNADPIDVDDVLSAVSDSLVQLVRDAAGITFEQARTATRTVLLHILAAVPASSATGTPLSKRPYGLNYTALRTLTESRELTSYSFNDIVISIKLGPDRRF